MINVALVDDQQLVRQRGAGLLSLSDDIMLLGKLRMANTLNRC
jgi:DNA-binding NarL/FixJ family response regulator